MPKNIEGGIFSRHSERSDPGMGRLEDKKVKDFGGLSKEGAEKAREIAHHDYKDMIDEAEEGSIIFIGGSSEEQRTKTTAELAGDELAEIYKNSDDVIVYTKSKIDELRNASEESESKHGVLTEIQEIIKKNPDKKIIFDFPFYLKEFSLRPHFRDKETGKHVDYMEKLIEQKKGEQDEGREAAREWFRNEGKIKTADGKTLEMLSPQQVAEMHIKGLGRLKSFAGKFIGERPLEIGIVGHGWQLDALAVYLANNGKVTSEAFEELFEGKLIEQPETGRIVITENKATLKYRGKDYEISQKFLGQEDEKKQ